MGKSLSKSQSKCTVYIWLPDGSRVGHASLQLANRTYISWWPKGGKKLRFKTPGTSKTLKDDKEIEGDPDYTLCFPPDIELDQKAMNRWWKEFMKTGTWSVVKNCCWAVMEALIAGGIREHVNIDEMNIANPIDLLGELSKINGISKQSGKSSTDGIKTPLRKVCDAKKSIVLAGFAVFGIYMVRKML